VQWVNQRNLRIVLEHVTAELLQAQPDDPLEFMIDVLQKGQQDNAEVARERPPTTGVLCCSGLSCAALGLACAPLAPR